MEPRCPALQLDSLLSEPPGKRKRNEVFPTLPGCGSLQVSGSEGCFLLLPSSALHMAHHCFLPAPYRPVYSVESQI